MGLFLAKNKEAIKPIPNPFNPLCTVLITNLLNFLSAARICYVVYGKISFETPSLKLLIIISV
jgi:hypothetical protein